MNYLDLQYQGLLTNIIESGVVKKDRTGTGTKSIFGYQIRHKMEDGFPLLTTKKMAWKQIVVELLWFLRGDTNIKYLVDNGCNIWNGDAYKNYCRKHTTTGNPNGQLLSEQLASVRPIPYDMAGFVEQIKTNPEFAAEHGELGPVYGKQWRDWGGRQTTDFYQFESNGYDKRIKGVDQIANLINELKNNPDGRRLMVNAWNVGELTTMVLPPCHYGFQCYTRVLSTEERNKWMGKHRGSTNNWKEHELDQQNIPSRELSLMWNQRSVDTLLGLPFNIASYGLLLKILAFEANMVEGELIGNLGDTHLYLNHIEQAKEQLKRKPHPLPKVALSTQRNHGTFDATQYGVEDFALNDYQAHPIIKAPLSN
jgi:thymidylate synthase